MTKFVQIILLSFFLGVSFTVNAQNEDGSWKIHNVFNEQRARVVDTGDMVYCLTDNNLNAYNKSTGEFESLNKLNRLSDFYVKNVYYNPKQGYVVVTYNNYNIDILLADGTTVNIPDLKDLGYTGDRTINDVTFGTDKIYVASNVGYLIIDDNKFCVEQAAVFGSSIKSIAEVGELILIASDSNVYYGLKGSRFKNLSQVTASSLGLTGTILPISDNTFFLNTTSKLYTVTIDSAKAFTPTNVTSAKVVDIQATTNGFIAIGGSSALVTNKYYAFDANGSKTAESSLPTDLANTLFTSQESDGSLWRLGATGLKHVTLNTASASVTAIGDEITPNNSTVKRVGEMEYNKNNKKIYITNGNSTYIYYSRSYSKTAYISSFDGSTWKNEIPTDLKGYKFQDPGDPVFDPSDPDVFYVGTWFQGVYKIKNNEIITRYDWNNSPLTQNWICCVPGIQFDSEGNMWLAQFPLEAQDYCLFVLPKDKQSLTTELTASDWIVPEINIERTNQNTRFLISKNDYKVLSGGAYQYPIYFIDNSTISQTPQTKQCHGLTQDDNRKIAIDNVLRIKEDANGTVWLAYNNGLLYFNPDESFSQDFKVSRPKSNDGMGYTLESKTVTDITIDDNNRKWVGTFDDGVYLLSEDGSQILKHFDTSNSCIPNNTVQSICWNSNTQSVFMGFNSGLLEYSPTNEDDYSRLSIYPNQITPDFNGQVTISNVPVNSTIYIKDSTGNTVKTLQATNSTVYWNGLDDNNTQIETGKYAISLKTKNGNNIESVKVFNVIK